MLVLSKIEAGKLEIDETLFDIAEAVEESMLLVRETAATSEISLKKELPGGLIFDRADQRMLTQIIVNLLSNAVKFTPNGGSVTLRTQRRKYGVLMISVSDMCYGMKAEDIPRAMKEFEQTEAGRQLGGTGLRLPLTKSMVELHGGTLSTISAQGKGTTAMFSVPRLRMQT